MSKSGTEPIQNIEHYRDYLLLLARGIQTPRTQAKLDASDVVQQTMLDAHAKLHEFQGANASQFAAWLRRILQNNFANAIRDLHRDKRDVRRERSIDYERMVHDSFCRIDQWLVASQVSPSQHFSQHEQLLKLAGALERLPEAQRQAIVLYHLQGMTLAEVAHRLQRSETAIGGLVYRGIRSLRQLMSNEA